MANASKRPWLIVGVLAAFMAVNFADKAVFGLAALPIMAELHLTHLQFGSLGSAFFVLFSVSALAVSALGDVAPRRWLIAVMALTWTIAQAPMIGPVGLGPFVVFRVLLGAGEGPAFPVAVHTAYESFPDQRRPVVTAWIQSGVPIGTAAAALGLTPFIVTFGWHAAYGLLAAVSLAWCLLWLVVTGTGGARPPKGLVRPTGHRVPLTALFSNRTIIGVMLAIFAGYWLLTLSLIWLPPFLETAAHLSAKDAGIILTLAWIAQIPLYPAVGWLSSTLRRRGFSSEIARGGLGGLGVALSGFALIGISFAHSEDTIIALVPVAVASVVLIGVTALPMIAEIAPPAQLGTALGATVAVYALAGIIAPIVIGRVIDTSGSVEAGYRSAFLGSGVFVAIAAVAAILMMRPTADRRALAISGAARAPALD